MWVRRSPVVQPKATLVGCGDLGDRRALGHALLAALVGIGLVQLTHARAALELGHARAGAGLVAVDLRGGRVGGDRHLVTSKATSCRRTHKLQKNQGFVNPWG